MMVGAESRSARVPQCMRDSVYLRDFGAGRVWCGWMGAVCMLRLARRVVV